MVNRTQDAKNREATASEKQPYETPRIEEEAVFETYALACSRQPLQSAKCNNNPRS